jgi:UDP-3-O-[3-hydroxymyristoyl] glucosamine N-acyltransferase
MNTYLISPLRAADVGGEIRGDADAVAKSAAGLAHATPESLVFYSGTDVAVAAAIPAGILLVRPEVAAAIANFAARALVAVVNPMARFCKILARDYDNAWHPVMANPTTLFPDAKIAPTACLEEGVVLGQKTEIFPGTVLHAPTRIGAGCRIQANAVIGAVGLAYAQEDGEYAPRFIHLGGVTVGDNVDIGANTTVVKGILQDTVIGKGTKIGNNVNIGHNVTIGKNCFISSGATLCGSVVVEDGAWLAPGSLVLNGVKVAARSQLGLGAVVSKDTDPDGVYLGYPARRIGERKG